jgi:hypothetical protein
MAKVKKKHTIYGKLIKILISAAKIKYNTSNTSTLDPATNYIAISADSKPMIAFCEFLNITLVINFNLNF